MSKLHIATSALNLTPLDWEGNARIISEVIVRAKDSGVDILCMPELCISGYGCEDLFFADWVFSRALESLVSLSVPTEGITCVLGCPILHQGTRYNCAVVVSNGEIAGVVPKQNLANSGVYYESRWFEPWRGAQSALKIADKMVPFGKLLFQRDHLRFGIEVCEDSWVENRPLKSFTKQGACLVLNLSASHFSLDKIQSRIDLSRKASGVVYVYSNHQGNEAGRLIYDGGSFIARGEEVLSATRRFSFKDFEITSKILELKEESIDSKQGEYAIVNLQSIKNMLESVEIPGENLLGKTTQEEFTLAVSLALFDYLRKSKHKAFVISLSGGADSSACALLSFLALELASKERGEKYVREILGQDDLPKLDFNKAIICAYLGTVNSSEETQSAAKSLASDLGARFLDYKIDDLVSTYTNKIEESFQDLSWDKHDIPLQNIQARSRGPLVWFLANLSNGLLLSTSNRSEAAVGYTTMDGDTCGGISPIGGISKTFLISWLKWLSEPSNHSFGKFPSLKLVLSNKPTAELRPREFSQTDEDDLMPYEILDFIEKRFLLERLSKDAIVESVIAKFSLKSELAETMVDKFFKLWTRNQWKRERYAPSFHIDEESLDPKSWCRYPILSASLTK